MRLFPRRHRTPVAAADAKPYRITIHAAGDQWHTFAMGPGDAVGVAGIRIDIHADGSIHARPNEVENPHLTKELAEQIEREQRRKHQRSGRH